MCRVSWEAQTKLVSQSAALSPSREPLECPWVIQSSEMPLLFVIHVPRRDFALPANSASRISHKK